MSERVPNPYVGPVPFERNDKRGFYGRDGDLRRLAILFIAQRIVLLYSPSGAGKTSLVQARLIPALEMEGFEVLPVIRVSQRPVDGSEGMNTFVYSTIHSLEEKQEKDKTFETFVDFWESRREALGNKPAVLFFDQFEEVVTIDPHDHGQKVDFFDQLGAVLEKDDNLWALFAIREDYLAELDPYRHLIPGKLNSTYRLELLNEGQALAAVQKPAADIGVTFSDEAAGKLIKQLRRVTVRRRDGWVTYEEGQFVEPVQIQVVCRTLWQDLKPEIGGTIEAEFIAAEGHVDDSLRDFFDETVSQIASKNDVDQRDIRDWFNKELITEHGLRGLVMGSEDLGLSQKVVDDLVDAHLIRAEERRTIQWYELVHDRFIEPILKSNLRWQAQQKPPLIELFVASPKAVGRGATVSLRWKVVGCDRISIVALSPEKGKETLRVLHKEEGRDGSPIEGIVRDKPDRDLEYVLTAERDGVATTEQVQRVSVVDLHYIVYKTKKYGEVVPIFSSSIDYNALYGDIDLAHALAERIGYGISEPHLSQIAQFASTLIGKNKVNELFLDILKQIFLHRIEAEGSPAMFSRRDMPEQHTLTKLVTSYYDGNGVTPYDVATRDMLDYLARFTISVYITASYHDFLEEALMKMGKNPRTEFFTFQANSRQTPSILEEKSYFVPSVEEPVVYHLFGHESEPSSLILAEDDYLHFIASFNQERYSDFGMSVPPFVFDKLITAPPLILGFDWQSWEFKAMLRSIYTPEARFFHWKRGLLQIDLHQERTAEELNYLTQYFDRHGFDIFWGDPQSLVRLWRDHLFEASEG